MPGWPAATTGERTGVGSGNHVTAIVATSEIWCKLQNVLQHSSRSTYSP